MASERLDVAVFGTGPAGLSSAREIGKMGHNIEVIGPETPRAARPVYTTARFIPSDLARAFFPPEFIKPLPYLRVLTTQDTDFRVNALNGSYFLVNYRLGLEALRNNLSGESNIHFSLFPDRVLKDVEVKDGEGGVEVILDGQKTHYDLVVNATGVTGTTNTSVNRNYDGNFLTEYIHGGTIRGKLEYPEMILVIGPAGGTCWVNPNIENPDYIDVVYSAYGPRNLFIDFLHTSKLRLATLIKFISNKPGIEIYSQVPEYTYEGLIRSQPSKRPLTKRVYAVGEAAGMAKPGTGDSYERAIMGGRLLAESLLKRENPYQFYEKWREKWKPDKLFFAGCLARLPFQEKGDLGGVIDYGAKLFGMEGNNQDEKMVIEFENFFVDGKIGVYLFIKLLSCDKFTSFFTRSILKQLELKFKEPVFSNKLPLPEV